MESKSFKVIFGEAKKSIDHERGVYIWDYPICMVESVYVGEPEEKSKATSREITLSLYKEACIEGGYLGNMSEKEREVVVRECARRRIIAQLENGVDLSKLEPIEFTSVNKDECAEIDPKNETLPITESTIIIKSEIGFKP
jgi:hypothetical protein